MSLIHLYTPKEEDCDKVISLLRKQNIDFLQTKISNDKESLKVYDLTKLPALKFKDTLLYDITKESVNAIVNKFQNYICALPNTPISKFTKKQQVKSLKMPINMKAKNPKLPLSPIKNKNTSIK